MRLFQKTIVFTLVFLLPIVGFAQHTPAELNGRIQTATDSIYTMASLWGTTFLDLMNTTQQYQDLNAITTDMNEFLETELGSFKKMGDISGSERLVGALVSLMNFEQDLVKNGFMPFEKLTNSSSENEVADMRAKLKELAAGEKDLLVAFNSARREYTTRNGIPITPPPPPKPVITANPGKKKLPPPAAYQQPTQPQPAISTPVMKKVDMEKEEKSGDKKADKEDKEDKEEKDGE